MKQKLLGSLVLLLIFVFVDGLFSFIQNPKLEEQVLGQVSDLLKDQIEYLNIEDSVEVSIGATSSAFVERVIDGDTIELTTGEKVRYIGIDTPETKHPTKTVGCYGKQASKKNAELVLGKKVILETDVSQTDRYGRLLRYVYIVDGHETVFVNEYLVREGYASSVSYPPDIKYQELFSTAQSQAREQKKGLWSDECLDILDR